jgi:hypothetical protein
MHRQDTELNFIRARSVLFLYDTQILVEEGAQLEFGTASRSIHRPLAELEQAIRQERNGPSATGPLAKTFTLTWVLSTHR